MKNLILTIVAIFSSFASSPNASAAYQTSPDQPNLDPVLIYSEESGNNYNIIRQTGDNRDILGAYNQIPYSSRMTEDKQGLISNFGNKFSYFDLEDRSSRDLYSPSNYTPVDFLPSTDQSQIFSIDRGTNNAVNFRVIDLNQNNDRLLGIARTGSKLYPIAWRDNKVILVEASLVAERIWIVDTDNNQITPTNYYNPAWISPDGQYMAMPSGSFSSKHNIYQNRFDLNGYSNPYEGQYRVIDPISGSEYGNLGKSFGTGQILGYSPSDQMLVYQQLNPFTGRRYYKYDLSSGQPSNISNPYDEIITINAGTGAIINVRGNVYIILIGNRALVNSQNRLNLYDSYYQESNASQNQTSGEKYAANT